MAHWKNEEEFLEELRTLSDHIPTKKPKPAVNDHLQKTRGKPTVYDFDGEEEEEEVRHCHPGRGYTVNDVLRRPGGKPSFWEREKEFIADIREVSADICSNESFKESLKNSEDVAPRAVPSFLKFRPASEFKRSAKVEEGTAVKRLQEKTIDNNSDLASVSFDIKSKRDFPTL